MAEQNIEFVRELWTATHKEGIAGALRRVDPAVEWSLHFVPGRIFHTDELRTFLTRLQGERQLLAAHPLRFESTETAVLASGSFRWGSIDGGLSDFQGHWVYEFEHGRLVRGWSYRTLGQARLALEGIADPAPSHSATE